MHEECATLIYVSSILNQALQRTFVGKNLKGNEATSVESQEDPSIGRPTITDEDLFLEIPTHHIRFSYIF